MSKDRRKLSEDEWHLLNDPEDHLVEVSNNKIREDRSYAMWMGILLGLLIMGVVWLLTLM